MKVLVTGGAGFIGSNFVRRSLTTRENLEITILDALTYAGNLNHLSGLEGKYAFVHGDIRNEKVVNELVSNADLVVHFAAETHNDNSLLGPESFITTNVNGTFNLLQAATKHNIRFHHISTDEVFGDLPFDSSEKFNEDSPYRPSSPYAASKAASDHLVRAWVRSFGLRATITNSSNNFGPNQHSEKLIPKTIELAASGIKPTVYGDGQNVRDWIHVDDHSDGVWAAIDKGAIGETYLLSGSNERTNLQVVTTILETLDLPKDFINFVPDRPGHDKRYALDSQKAQRELQWMPRAINFETELANLVRTHLNK